MKGTRRWAVAALALVCLGFVGGCGDEAKKTHFVSNPQVVHTFDLKYSTWKVGVDVSISSQKRQTITVDGLAEASKNAALVSLFYDKTNLILDANGNADPTAQIKVHGDKQDQPLIPQKTHNLTLVPKDTTILDDTIFTVTITEIDPM